MRLCNLIKLFEKIIVSLVVTGLIMIFSLSYWDSYQSDRILKQVILAYSHGNSEFDRITITKPNDFVLSDFSETYQVLLKDSLPVWGQLYVVKFVSDERYAVEILPGIFEKHQVIFQGKVDEKIQANGFKHYWAHHHICDHWYINSPCQPNNQ